MPKSKVAKFPEPACSQTVALCEESDRGCVLVAHGFAEEALGHLIWASLRQRSVLSENILVGLFRSTGMLYTFSNRAKLAAALGLIDANVYSALVELNDLRVHFAHHRGRVTLTEARVRNIRQHITKKHLATAQYWTEKFTGMQASHGYSQARVDFVLAAVAVLVELDIQWDEQNQALEATSGSSSLGLLPYTTR